VQEIGHALSGTEFLKPGMNPKSEKENYRGIRVLVVDDDNFVRELIAKVLRKHLGLEVVTGDCGSRAIAEALTGEYDAAIIDLILPRTSGIEAIKVIKKMMPGFPILALTSELMNGRIEYAESCGANRVFYKPVRISLLIDELKKILGRDGICPSVDKIGI